MLQEILLLTAIGAGTAYVVDPQFKNAVNTAIASTTGATNSQTAQSTSTNASNSGAGWQQIINDLSQIFHNQTQLQSELSTAGSSGNSPPPINIVYPNSQNPANNSNTGLSSSNSSGITGAQADMLLANVITNPSQYSQKTPSQQLVIQSALLSNYASPSSTGTPNTINASSNPLTSASASAANQQIITSNNAANSGMTSAQISSNPYAKARALVNQERAAGLLPA